MKNADITTLLHPAGRPFVAIAAVLALLFIWLFGTAGFFVGLILVSWVVYFFRDPPRTTPVRAGLVIAPADGRVIMIKQVKPEADLGLGEEELTRISIFLNVFDVHVNRVPVDGTITHVRYRAGKFFNASLDKASEDNERNAVAMTMEGEHPYTGQTIGVVQIAGLIARRILCAVQPGHKLLAGERFGLIRFGSRTDVYLPRGMTPLVCVGQRTIGGETVLADAQASEAPRKGEVR
ncbi:MAG: phosphatidylserine decarboxylase [Alphaproteobacteria bacterium]|nr:phosphatidylserine decarboxylase [Alphaproteobacteria bacterium]